MFKSNTANNNVKRFRNLLSVTVLGLSLPVFAFGSVSSVQANASGAFDVGTFGAFFKELPNASFVPGPDASFVVDGNLTKKSATPAGNVLEIKVQGASKVGICVFRGSNNFFTCNVPTGTSTGILNIEARTIPGGPWTYVGKKIALGVPAPIPSNSSPVINGSIGDLAYYLTCNPNGRVKRDTLVNCTATLPNSFVLSGSTLKLTFDVDGAGVAFPCTVAGPVSRVLTCPNVDVGGRGRKQLLVKGDYISPLAGITFNVY